MFHTCTPFLLPEWERQHHKYTMYATYLTSKIYTWQGIFFKYCWHCDMIEEKDVYERIGGYMAKKRTEDGMNLDAILFKCRDILRAARNSGSFFEKRDMMLTLVFLRFIGENRPGQNHAWQNAPRQRPLSGGFLCL